MRTLILKVKFIIPVLVGILLLAGCTKNTNSQKVILIAIDGFRWDYTKKFETPNIDKLINRGVKAERLLPVFPTKTFTNFYSIFTGLYPKDHGIISNKFYDPDLKEIFGMESFGSEWFKGEPVWITAAKQGKITAAFNVVGAPVDYGGIRPTYWHEFDSEQTNTSKVNEFLDLFNKPIDEHPDFTALYFSTVDNAGHNYGPEDTLSIAKAVLEVDNAIGDLINGLESLNMIDEINFILFSDHGMTGVSKENYIFLKDLINEDNITVISNGTSVSFWLDENDKIRFYNSIVDIHPEINVFLKEDIPLRLKYFDNDRIAPVFAYVNEGWVIRNEYSKNKDKVKKVLGMHGYDNGLSSMGAFFIAAGPAFKEGINFTAFENIQIYNLICHILGIKPSENDGEIEIVSGMLKD